jgi:hypothetical protein
MEEKAPGLLFSSTFLDFLVIRSQSSTRSRFTISDGISSSHGVHGITTAYGFFFIFITTMVSFHGADALIRVVPVILEGASTMVT